jgi:hypothetical protein
MADAYDPNTLDTKQPQDWINLILAALLLVSPWLFDFAGERVPAWHACIAAVVIGGFAMAALAAFAEWEEWINLALGIWLAAAPWVLGFAGITNAMWTHLVVGLLVAAAAAWEIWQVHHEPPRAVV